MPNNWAKNWTNPLVILTKRWAKNSVRSHQWAEIQKGLATDPAARAGRLASVSRQQERPAAVVQVAAVRVLPEARPVVRKRRRDLSMG